MKKLLIIGILGLIGYGIYKAKQQPTAKPKTVNFGEDVPHPAAQTATAARMIGGNTANPNAKK